MSHNGKSENIFYGCALLAVLLGLYLSARHSYLLFHTLIELVTITIAFALAVLMLNTLRFQGNTFLRILGIGYPFIAFIDLLHTLAYKGMGVFPGAGANLPTQLWIAARSLQALTLCAAPLFLSRRVGNRVLLLVYGAAVAGLVTLVFSGAFPDCYLEGAGLTPFKKTSEYVISALLILSMYLLYRKRGAFKESVFLLTVASIGCTALSEMTFTTYLSVYGMGNLLGHFLKLGAFYLIYRAILVTGLKDPFDLIFKELRESQEALRKSHDVLEEKVRERTAEVRAREEKYRALIECANDGVFIHEIGEDGGPGPFLEVNEVACRRLGYSREELTTLGPLEIDDPRYRERIALVMERLYREGHALFETAQLTREGRSMPVEVSTRLLELDGKRLLFSLVRDITERKAAEAALHRLNRELRAISDCNQLLMRMEDEQELLDEICRIICEKAGYRMAWVGYAEGDEAKTVRPVAWAGAEEGYLAEAASWDESERGGGPTGIAIRSGTSACIADFESDPLGTPRREAALRRGYCSSIALPLKDEDGSTFGALTIYATEPHAFAPPEEVRLLEELAGDLAFGVKVLHARRARREAERSLALLSFALDNVREDVLLIDQSAHFHYVNEESCRELGYRRDELLRLRVPDINPYFTPERWVAHWEEVKERGSLTFEGEHRRRDGRSFPVEINANYLEYDGEGYILGLVRDITERKRTEAALKNTERQLRTLVASLPDNIARFDPEGRHTFVSDSLTRTFGRPVDFFIGKTLSECGASGGAADDLLLEEKIRQVFEAGVPSCVEVEWQTTSGTRFYDLHHVPERDERGGVVSVLAIAHDITERKRADNELHRLKDELEQRVQERTQELEAKIEEIERLNRLFIGRELRMVELKEEIGELKGRLHEAQELTRVKTGGHFS